MPAPGGGISVLKAKLANMLRFQLGDPASMARGTAGALAALAPDAPGRSHILGRHAFALEALGGYAAAERLGRQALAADPEDTCAIHAVAHTFEMRGMADAGVASMAAQRPAWSQAGGFAFHSAWHLALFHLELGRYERVLDLYDREIRPHPTPDARDIANGVGMLWRLRQLGVPVGTRWDELAWIARQRVDDTTMLFFTLHYLSALRAATAV
ncbi:MAG: hypothetical protein JSR21_01510 [Proteobacteria bacterium]|nr:hypothetical protein [Pseudomonadota bacterium]